MLRGLFCVVLVSVFFVPCVSSAQDEGPPISIASPDKGTTFAYGTIKNHSLIWSRSQGLLIARVTFTDVQQTDQIPPDDTHEFRLPGVTFDPATGVFSATTAHGEIIPVAHFKKTLFIRTIETLPNARIRIIHPRGVITVILEAISPNDPALHPPPSSPDADAAR